MNLSFLVAAMVFSPASSDLWFFADADHATRLNGSLFEEYPNRVTRADGKFGAAYGFLAPDTKKRNVEFWPIKDGELLRTFPAERGSFCCWFRSSADTLGQADAPAFAFGPVGKADWLWTGGTFKTARKGGKVKLAGYRRTDTWRHFAATWDETALVCYLDGLPAGTLANPSRTKFADMDRAQLHIGNAGRGAKTASNLILDEIAIFNRALTADEVRSLAQDSVGLSEKLNDILLSDLRLPYFWRDDPASALRFRLSASAGDYAVTAEVGRKALGPRQVKVTGDRAEIVLPFDVARFKAGTYPWKVAVASASGLRVEKSGTLRVLPRLDRGKFKFFNWGGSRQASIGFLKEIGINTQQAKHLSAARRAIENGLCFNLRYDNDKDEAVRSFDPDRIVRETHERLQPYAGVYGWVSTLANTEMYYNMRWLRTATNSPAWRSFALSHFDGTPDWRFTLTPDKVDFKAKGMDTFYRGVFADDAYETLSWFRTFGNPLYLTGGLIRKTVHPLSPGNRVWSEPIMSDGFATCFDRVADRIYDYLPEVCLYKLRAQYGNVRPSGRGYMPTLGMGYWHYKVPPVPKGLKKCICQSADELMIKSWMAIGSVPAEDLSYFAANMWEYDVVEPDAVRRYGAFVRERFAPACDLLRNMTNAAAPFAVAGLDSSALAGSKGWSRSHYMVAFGEQIGRAPVAFDVVGNREVMAGCLTSYRYVFLPWLSALTKKQNAALDLAAKAGVRLVADDKCAFDYPNMERLPEDEDAVANWLGRHVGELREGLFAWSEQDGTNAYTFVKEHRGVRYVVVVNNTRRRGGAPQNEYCTVDWYNPLGVSARIDTHLDLPAGAAVYQFNSDERPEVKHGCLSLDYAPAEGRVFAVYPRALKKLVLTKRESSLLVKVLDADGSVAPGRQVVELAVTDPTGVPHDETGRYVVEGETEIPLRFADDDVKTGAWQVAARELTSGLKAGISFE